VNAVLDAAYDVSTFYDWWNQPSLAAPRFIAPNLVSTPLPAGGSTGGIFLLRFQMAGTAWNRLLAEVPGFLVQFNARYQLSPASYPNEASLVALGQVALDAAAGRANATVEGKTFAQWFEEQRVLDSDLIPGPKLHVQAFPLDPTPGSSDFGVFAIVANAFQLEPNGNETLFGGRAFPVYWREDGTRFLTSVQDDVLEIAGAYGSVAPNFPATSGTTPYRTLVDVPFAGLGRSLCRSSHALKPAGGFGGHGLGAGAAQSLRHGARGAQHGQLRRARNQQPPERAGGYPGPAVCLWHHDFGCQLYARTAAADPGVPRQRAGD